MGRTVRIVGAPTDYGADRRGVDMGPSAIRYAGLESHVESAGLECADWGNLEVPIVERAAEPPADDHVKFIEETEAVCTQLADVVADILDAGEFPLVLGGDHSISIGSIGGSSRGADLGVLWFDAHGDYNTPATSPSGNIHGMTLAAALGHGAFAEEAWAHAPGFAEENLVWVGLRDLDPGEAERIRESEATAFTMADVDERGMVEVIETALDVATAGVDGLHVSLDLDWLEPTEAPGVGTPVAGGATYREAHFALERVAARDAETGLLRSMDLVEVNPILDDRNETAELATELAASALGKRIL